MTSEELPELHEMVDKILAYAAAEDDEAAHEAEDNLYLFVINLFCPDWVKAEIKRVSDADFCRWCA